jgi:DNA replication protein DnaC
MSNKIVEYDFNDLGIEEIRGLSFGMNWPIVYILNGNKEVYIGETASAYQRMKQHKRNPVRKKLDKVNIIYDSEFNKSAILDIESLLINYMLADQKYKLQNISSGINSQSNYYLRENYLNKFDDIWKALFKRGLVNHERIYLENLDIFKFSPYKRLTEDQHIVAIEIIKTLIENKSRNDQSTFFVSGVPGTGKSVLAVYLMKLLIESQQAINELSFDDDNINFITLLNLISQYHGKLKVGLVIPMESLRKTLKNVFKQVHGLKANMVIAPSEVIKKHYDILIVDEAHRLRRRVNLMPGLAHTFDNVNDHLKIENGDELDWIMSSSDYQIFFYDSNQSVKPSDVRKEKFREIINQVGTIQFTLTSQMRVKGGDYYISSIYKLLEQKLNKQIEVENYELKIFDDVEDMY